MDRFKFRIWDIKQQKYRQRTHHEADTCLDCLTGKVLYGEGIEIYGEEDDKDVVLEQSTGLKDKNGKLVYEGDIVAEVYSGLIDRPGVVKYGEFNCSCCDGVYGWYIDGGDIRRFEENYDRCVIIGNIHENADLLGEE